ncbi:hypothetical protein KIN20_029426 [Parelaphostrongylus tenuis]|uniref:Secreted protein n=1 Tax=Parelaphostrongylus tenuis TaxID=148309 RepID=A0AAD5R2L2_PARTN|nr:hypothetical protein KIN20_029426 [Parelaphostrongylus tenuis]
MDSLRNVAGLPTTAIMLLAMLHAVLGCGVMPAGQTRTWSFNSVPSFPGIAATRQAASSFVSRLVMQTLNESQCHHSVSSWAPRLHPCALQWQRPVISTIHDENKSYSRRSNVDLRDSHDHEHYHGQLVETDVARSSEQGSSNIGIGSICIALLLGSRKLSAEL